MDDLWKKVICWLRGHQWEEKKRRFSHEFDTVDYTCRRCDTKHRCTTDAMDLPRGRIISDR